ncbi:MAG: cobalamin-binding protein [Desulfobacteraceae bacterium]|nr:MAG: cobalamin-binding protein [Desulfobacteraceae bacterium]
MDTLTKIAQLVEKGQIQESKATTQKALDVEKIPAMEILNKGLIVGLDAVGKAFSCQKAFVPELMTAGMAMKESLEVLRATFESSDAPPMGTVVIGTVEGDVHDVGKNIVAMMLQGAGFKVHDLGIDIPVAKFVEAVKKYQPDILALSALYTPTRLAMAETLEAMVVNGLRNKVKVIIGGAPIDQNFCNLIKADGYAPDAPQGVQMCKKWLRSASSESHPHGLKEESA